MGPSEDRNIYISAFDNKFIQNTKIKIYSKYIFSFNDINTESHHN